MQRLPILLLLCLFSLISKGQELTKLNDRFYKLEAPGSPNPDQLFKPYFFESGFHSLREIQCQEDPSGNQHCRYEISMFNIPVKGFHLTTHYNRRSQITSYMIPRAIPGSPEFRKRGAQLSIQKALEITKNNVNATAYTYLAPSANSTEAGLIYVPIDYNFEKPTWVLAYEIDVRTSTPLRSERWTIDANTGAIIFTENRLCTFVPGTAVTRYHGTQPIETTAVNGGFVLNDQTRGTGITTTDLNTGSLFFDADNTWDNANTAMDEVAGDAHWGSAATFDFYLDLLGYNGLDGNGRGVNSNVHLNDANAFWDGENTSYGDGFPGGTYDQPFTYINIIGHEITHAVTEFSSGLIYDGESGAMNESISDIIGMSVENQTNPGSVDWLVGQEASSEGNYFRNMANPKELSMADTYDGEFWNDGAGVHTNSSIGNYWFYLLVTGESDTNDLGYSYNVNSIGWEKAYRIAHNTWTQYLSPSSNYQDCALFSLEVAEDLYGNCSSELAQVRNAWAAVGVLTNGSEQNFSASPRVLCEIPGTVFFSGSGDITNPTWDFGDGNQSSETTPAHTYTQNGNYTVTLSGEDCNNDPFTVVKTDYIIVDENATSCDTTIMEDNLEELITLCSGILVDDGGDGLYSNSVYATLEIATPGVAGYQINFDFFETEASYDFLNIFAFDGNNFVSVGNYSGTHTGTSLDIQSDRIRITWDTDGSVTRPGFILSWECVEPEIPVAGFLASDTISCGNLLTLTDESTGPPTEWTWLLDGVVVSTEQNPTINLVNPGSYDIGLITCNAVGCDSLVLTDYVTYDPTLEICQIIVMDDNLVETSSLCQGTLMDDGGAENNYSNSVDAILNVAAPGAVGYEIEFISFSTESGYDEMQLFVNNGNGLELFAEYEGEIDPGTTITVLGSDMQFVWNTDGSVTRPGFEIRWNCLSPTQPPSADFSFTSSGTCSSEVQLTDQSAGFPTSWEWFLNEEVISTDQNPIINVPPGTHDVTLIACNDLGCDTTTMADLIIYDPTLPACQIIVMNDDLFETSSLCQGTLVDDGGIDDDYSNSVDATLEIAAPGALGYSIDFETFSTESGFDEMQLWVDNGNGFEFFAEYEGFLEPFNVNVSGSRIRFIWNTDSSVTLSGFEIRWTCQVPGVPVANFSNTPDTICSNMVQLVDNSQNFPDSWSWSINGTIVSTEQNPVVTLGEPGSYDLELIACNNFGCDTLATPDYLTFDPTGAACNEIVLVDNVQQFSQACAGSFYDDGGVNGDYGNNVNASLEITAPGAVAYLIDFEQMNIWSEDTLFLYVDSGNGFELHSLYESFPPVTQIEVPGNSLRFIWQTNDFLGIEGFKISWECIIPALPIAEFTLATPGPCTNQILLSDQSSGVPDTWTWLLDDELISSEQNPTFNVDAGIYDVTLVACNDLGCDTSTVADLINYDPTLPACQIIVMSNGLDEFSSLCEGTLVDDGGVDNDYENNVFSELEIAVPGAFAFQINFDFFETENSFDYLRLYVDEGNGFVLYDGFEGFLTGYTEVLTGSRIKFEWDTDGSVTDAGFEVSWICISDGVAPLVSPTAEVEDCENTVYLAANSPNADQVIWDFGDGTTGEGMEVTHTYTTTGTFEISATATNTTGETPFALSVSPDYKPVFFTAPENMLINESENISIISPPEDRILNIAWELDDNYVTNVYAHSLSFDQIGIYELKVVIMDIDGCVSELTETIEVGTVGTEDFTTANIRVQPNPTKDLIQVLDLQTLDHGYSLCLINTIGQRVYQQTPAPGIEQLTIEMGNLPAGVYYLEIKSPGKNYRGKRIVKVN